jgi:Uma2 family endonuclease
MTYPAAQPRHSIAEYLGLERTSDRKHEFHNGEILAMSGGSPEHSLIALNIGGELRNRLKGNPCRAYESNLRVSISRTGRYVYPDASVVCGPLQLDPADPKGETVTNPRVIVEVLSPSTEKYDRLDKFDNYRQIDSLEEYVLASQDRPRVEVFRRQSDGAWALKVFAGIDATAELQSVRITLPLAEVYAGAQFPPVTTAQNSIDDTHAS